jgi:NADH-quinone oxidoreductase subunit F
VETFTTVTEGVFAGGDVVTGPNTVVDAVAAGKVAAESIDRFLSGEQIAREYEVTRPSKYIEPVELSEEELLEVKRPSMPCLSPQERKTNFREVEGGLKVAEAVKEARRCFRCDLETKDGRDFMDRLREGSVVGREV